MCLRGVFAQGPKIPPGGLTGKPWNRGAPLSKKTKKLAGTPLSTVRRHEVESAKRVLQAE